MTFNSIFTMYHTVLKHFDLIGVPYILQRDGTADIPQLVMAEMPVSISIEPLYNQDVIWITMRPGLEISKEVLPEMLLFVNYHNEYLPSGSIFIGSTSGELMIRESLHTHADTMNDAIFANILKRMHFVLFETIGRCVPILDDGKTCSEALELWEKASDDAKNAGGSDIPPEAES